MSTVETIARRVTATDYGEAMQLALSDWNDNWADGRALSGIALFEQADPGWRLVRGKLRADFAVQFSFLKS